MRFGLFGAAQAQRHADPDVDSAAGFKDYIEYLVEAEALGFYSSFLVEHHFTGFGQVSATLNMIDWIAARTSTLRVGTAVIVLPWHNPVLLAEQAATVDLLSGGRLDFGVGRGYRHNEFAGFRIPVEQAEERFLESLEILVKSWTNNERWSYRGKYYEFDDIVVEPPTAQHPHPPLWQGAGSEGSLRKVAAMNHGLLLDQFASMDETLKRFNFYKEEMLRNDHGFDAKRVGVSRAFNVVNTREERDEAITRRMAAQQRLHAVSQTPNNDNKASIMAFSDTREANEEATLFGTPDEIRRKIEWLRDQGVEYILLNGGGTSRQNLRRFAREIMPHFRTED